MTTNHTAALDTARKEASNLARCYLALLNLLSELTPDDPCVVDRFGNCQAHMWFDDEEVCAVKRAQIVLQETGMM